MGKFIMTTIVGAAIDVIVVCALVFLMSVGFGFEFTISLGISVWAATLLIRWVCKFTRKEKAND